jgi:peroxiredoxin
VGSLTGSPVPSALADARVLDRSARERRLGSFWEERPCVIAFLRQFGCIGCEALVTDLVPRLAEIQDAGASTVLVGNGPAEHVAAFAERHVLDDKSVDLVTDPSLGAFRAAGLLRSAWATYGPRAMIFYVRALGSGLVPRGRDGDRLQQSGAIVVARDGTVALHHVSTSLGDHVSASDLVEAVLGVALRESAFRV